MLDARARELRFARGAGDARRLETCLHATQAVGRSGVIGGDPLRFDSDVVVFDLQLGERFSDAVAGGRRMLQRMPEGGRRVDRGKHFAARRFHVGLEPLDAAVRHVVGIGLRGQHRGGAIALGARLRGGGPSSSERCPGRLAAGLEDAELRRHRLDACAENLNLLSVEGESAAAGC